MPRLLKLMLLVMAALLLASTSPVLAQDTETPNDKLEDIMAGVEGLVTQLAMTEGMNSEEVQALRRSLAELYNELEDLGHMMVGIEGIPLVDLTEWQPYPDADLDLAPEDVTFNGWNIDSGFELGWGDYGDVTLDVQNSYYRANWVIHNAYEGAVEARVEAGPDGVLTLTINDAVGTHEYRIDNGGIGPIFVRYPNGDGPPMTSDNTPAVEEVVGPIKQTQPVVPPAWAQEYLHAVDAGDIEASPTMDWFINQTRTHAYENDALRDLGDAVSSLSAEPKYNEPLGFMYYYVNEDRKEMHIPDPRTYPEGFSHVINKMYILTLSDQVCVVEIR